MRTKLFCVVCVLFLCSLIALEFALPERVASHFDIYGRANGWSAKSHFVGMMAFLGIGLPGLLYLVVPALPISFIKIPNKRYWSAPAHASYVRCVLKDAMLEMVTILAGLFAGLNFAVILANEQIPPAIPTTVFIALLLAFLPAVLFQTWHLMGRFRIPASA